MLQQRESRQLVAAQWRAAIQCMTFLQLQAQEFWNPSQRSQRLYKHPKEEKRFELPKMHHQLRHLSGSDGKSVAEGQPVDVCTFQQSWPERLAQQQTAT